MFFKFSVSMVKFLKPWFYRLQVESLIFQTKHRDGLFDEN